MSFWDENISALGMYHEKLQKKISLLKEEGYSEFVKEDDARDGNKYLVLNVNGADQVMNSRFRPIQEACTYANQFDGLKDYSVSIFFGFGNGLFPREIVKKGTEKSYFVFYEPDLHSFLYAMHQCDLTDLFAHKMMLLYIHGVNETEISIDLPSWLRWQNLPLAEIYPLPKYKEIFPEIYKVYLNLVRDVFMRAHLTVNTLSQFAQRYMYNAIHQYRFFFEATSGLAFRNVFPQDMPAVLVSAGPSLQKNIHLLKDAKNRCFILCVDTALRKLLAEGIIPDAVVSVDPRKWAAYHESFLPYYKEIMWVTETNSNVDVTNAIHSYRNVFLSGEELIANHLFESHGSYLPNLSTGGSVANTGFSLLELWGFSTIIMIGQDLALTGNRRYSDSDVDAEQAALDQGYNLYDVEGYFGDTVKTRDDYLAYLKWFEGVIPTSAFQNVINATEGGAMIKGATNMSLKAALEEYAKIEYNVREIIDSVPKTFDDEAKLQIDGYLHNLPSRAKFFMRQFKEGMNQTERAMTLLSRDNYSMKEYQAIQKKLGDIEASTSQELEFILISNRACDVDQRISREMMVNPEESLGNDEDVLRTLFELYSGFYDAAVEMKDLAEAMVEKLDEEGWK